MELLKEFETYTYYRDTHEFYIRDVTELNFAKLYNLIQKYNLRFKIDMGIRIWLD
jgi:hypothetical protein